MIEITVKTKTLNTWQ